MNNDKLIIIPYAYGGNTGVSIQKPSLQFTTYMKNNCVACLSAKENAGSDTDVMLISNIEIPDPYASLLKSKGIILQLCPFDSFNFDKAIQAGREVRWHLAFYKICALKFCVLNTNYKYFCYMDSDVFIQRSFERIWNDSKYKVMLYDINEPTDGYMVKEMQHFLQDECFLTHYGGEFFAASKFLAEKFVCECERVYNQMVDIGYITTSGDEFIISIAASRMLPDVKNSGAYIRRYWTGSYRLMCDDYKKNNISILHIPAEKEHGMIKLYDRYVSHGKIPTCKDVWKVCNFYHPSIRVCMGLLLRKIIVIFR